MGTNLNGAWFTTLCSSSSRLWIGNGRLLPNGCTFFGHRGKNKVVEAADEDEVEQEHEAKNCADESTAKEIAETGCTAGRMEMDGEGQEKPLESQGSVKIEETPFNKAVAAEKGTKHGEHPKAVLPTMRGRDSTCLDGSSTFFMPQTTTNEATIATQHDTTITARRMKMDVEGQEKPLESQCSVKIEETPFNKAVAAEKGTKHGEHPKAVLSTMRGRDSTCPVGSSTFFLPQATTI